MNDFQIYEILCELCTIAEQYTDGKKYSEKIRHCADRVSFQLYRAAVIGEFKRGKSSMINALLGTEVLPTSVLPMTAVITRVIYGDEKRIIIRYKNGDEEQATIEQIVDFATKYDEEKALKASLISEILVYYPSVFCKNHIEIIDTPGMNDNEDMTAVTMSVLGSIDAAIMVISAQEPLSMTEQDLILTMIAEQGIHHIIFVVTHIDTVSDDSEDQDRLIGFISDRIKNDLLKRAEEAFSDNENHVRKAHRILEQPDVFGVSSVQAIKGFIQDSEQMLQKSRFPKFKKELLTLLTAAQSTDIRLNARDYANEIKANIEIWSENEKKHLETEQNNIVLFIEKYQYYFQSAQQLLNNLLKEKNNGIDKIGLDLFENQSIINDFVQESNSRKLKGIGDVYRNYFCAAADSLKKTFIKWLYTVKSNGNTDENILAALQNAAIEACEIIDDINHTVKITVGSEMQRVNDAFLHIRPQYNASEHERQLFSGIHAFAVLYNDTARIPELNWIVSPIPAVDSLVGLDVIQHIKSVIIRSLEKYANEVKAYIAEWRTALISYHNSLLADNGICDRLQNDLSENSARIAAFELNRCKHFEKLQTIQKKLSDMKSKEE